MRKPGPPVFTKMLKSTIDIVVICVIVTKCQGLWHIIKSYFIVMLEEEGGGNPFLPFL
jgi:hypothetical protein